MSEEDLEDRQVSFDCLMTIVSRNTKLVTSIPILQFLGIDLLADRKYAKRRAEYLKGKETKSSAEGEGEEDIFGEKTSPEEIKSDGKTSPNEDNDLFAEEVITKNSTTTSIDDKGK